MDRKRINQSIDDLQADFDTWRDRDDRGRTHREKYGFGELLISIFSDSKKIAKGMMLNNA